MNNKEYRLDRKEVAPAASGVPAPGVFFPGTRYSDAPRVNPVPRPRRRPSPLIPLRDGGWGSGGGGQGCQALVPLPRSLPIFSLVPLPR